MRRVISLALVLTLLGCGRESWQASSAWPTMPSRIEFKLSASAGKLRTNGVQFVVVPDDSASLVEIDVRVQAGAAEDPPGKPGLAHLVEHLLFDVRPGKADGPSMRRQLRLATVSYNAFTSRDETTFVNLAHPAQLETVVRLEAARFAAGCRGLDSNSFEREREVVRNELRQRGEPADDEPPMQLTRQVFGAAHPYAHEVGGTDAALAALTLDDACRFIEDHYAPSQLIVAIAGKVDGPRTELLLARHFGALAPREGQPRTPVPAPVFAPGTRLQGHAPGSPVVYWALPIPAAFDPVSPEAELLADQLESAVYDRLRDNSGVLELRVFTIGGRRQRVLVIGVRVRASEDVKRVERHVHELLEQLPVEITRVFHLQLDVGSVLRQRFVMGSLFALEGLAGRTSLLADYMQYAPGQRFGDELDHFDRLGTVLERLRRAADYLEQARALELVLLPAEREGGRQRAALGWSGVAPEEHDGGDVDPAEAHRALKLPARSRPLPEARRFVLDNGLEVILQPSPGLLPLVTTRLELAVGSAHEPEGQAGMAELAANVLQVGSFAPSARFFEDGSAGYQDGRARDSEEQLDSTVSPDATSLVWHHASRDTVEVLHSLAFRVHAEIDPAPVERVIRWFERARARDRRVLAAITGYAVKAALYGPKHAYARSNGMTLRSIMHIDADDVIAFMHRHYVARNATLIVAGNFDPEAIEAGIRDEFGKWPAGETTPPVAPETRARQGAMHLGVDVGGDDAQLEIALAYPAAAGVDEHHAGRLVLARMLELRMNAVRDRLGASYGVNSGLTEATGPGSYLADGRVDVERAGESLALMRAGVDALRQGDEGFDQDFVRARRLVLAELLAHSSSSGAIAESWAFRIRHILPVDYDAQLARQVAELTPETVQALVATELRPEAEVLVVTGARAAVEKAYAGAGLPAPRFMAHWPPPK